MVKFINPSGFVNSVSHEDPVGFIEMIGRSAYQSYDKITENSAAPFVRKLIKSGHESVLEHVSMTAQIICDRGASHEIVRHRLASYTQESTRYVDYTKRPLKIIIPHWFSEKGRENLFAWSNGDEAYNTLEGNEYAWFNQIMDARDAYFCLINGGLPPQDARGVLPAALATELTMTANLREWRHIFKMRGSVSAHPDVRKLMLDILDMAMTLCPIIFEDLKEDSNE